MFQARALFFAPLLFVATLQQQQCNIGTMVQGKAAEGVRAYFPAAEVKNDLPCVLTIETHVGNVSKALLWEIAHKAFQDPRRVSELTLGMDLGGYNYLVIAFTEYGIVFHRYTQRYYVLDPQEGAHFFQTAFNPCFSR